ncbi:MAG: 30S ribosomal protein S6 [Rhodothermia bacterium]|nr:30S ribosomal protein S6 [Rhodothermia bacterium]
MAQNMYDMLYILNPVLTEEQQKSEIERINAFITENGGSILKVDTWGLQKLAYSIQKKRNGYYVNVYFNAPGDVIVRLKRLMEISDNHLRYLVLKFDAKMMRNYEKTSSTPTEEAQV